MNRPLLDAQKQEAAHLADIPLDQIQADADQVRREFDEEFIAQLAESIRANGVIQPIVVRPIGKEKYEIIAGENRYRASRIAGKTTIPALIRADLSEDDCAVLQLLENLQRKDLSLSDTISGVTQLVEKIGFDKAVEQLGMSKSWVSKRSSVKDMPAVIRESLANGQLQDLETAHSLHQLMQVAPDDAERFTDWLSTTPEQREEEGMRESYYKPNRDNVREALQEARAQAEEEANDKAAAEAARNDPAAKAAAKQLKQKQRELKAKQEKIQEVWDAAKELGETMEKKFAATLGLRLPNRSSFGTRGDSPLTVSPEFFSPYGGGGKVPASAEVARFNVGISGGAGLLRQWANAAGNTALEIRVSIDNLTVERAEKIAAALNHEGVKFSFGGNVSGQALHDLLSRLKNKATPPKVQKAAGGAIGDVAKFIAACLDKRDKNAQIKASLVYEAYTEWCKDLGADPIAFTANTWGDGIAAAGIEKKRSNGIQYTGCKLKVKK